MTDNQAMEITEGLADNTALIARLNYVIDTTRSAADRMRSRSRLTSHDLRQCIAALSHAATSAAGDAEVERVRIVEWLRQYAECCRAEEQLEGALCVDAAADAIERGDHHA